MDKIHIAYSDSLLNTTSLGDSVINYNTLTTNFSFRYTSKELNDIIFLKKRAKAGEKINPINVNLMVYKRLENVYLVIMYPRNVDERIGNLLLPGLLE
jgi:hypothetical protein